MAVKQGFATVVYVYAETWILVAVAFAVTWYWATCYPLAVGSFRVAQALGYLFCLH
jgi:hypothetical protein